MTDEALELQLGTVRLELERRDTQHPVFHGSWDWHSAVQGHWARLTFGALRDIPAEQDWVVTRLRSSAFQAEVEHLLANPEFERPYGRAWLLALMSTYERVTSDLSLRGLIAPVARELHA